MLNKRLLKAFPDTFPYISRNISLSVDFPAGFEPFHDRAVRMRSLHFRDAFPFRMEYRFTRSCLSDCAPDGFKNGLPCFVPGRGPCSPAAARTSF